MAYLKKNQQDIYENMVADLRSRLPEVTDFQQGSVIRSLIETLAFEQATFYQQLDHIYNASFVNTASGPNLEKVVAILDVYRNESLIATLDPSETTYEETQKNPGRYEMNRNGCAPEARLTSQRRTLPARYQSPDR